MGYRFYTAKEFAKLNAADERRRRKNAALNTVRYPVQEELKAVLHLVPEDRKGFAKVLTYLRVLSPKQLAAAQRFVDRAKEAA